MPAARGASQREEYPRDQLNEVVVVARRVLHHAQTPALADAGREKVNEGNFAARSPLVLGGHVADGWFSL